MNTLICLFQNLLPFLTGITAKYIILRFDSRFKDSISVCEVFSYFYGRSAESFSVVISLTFYTGAAVTGFIVLGSTISYSCNLPYNINIFIAILSNFVTFNAGGFLHVLKNTDSSMFDLTLHMKFSYYCLPFYFKRFRPSYRLCYDS